MPIRPAIQLLYPNDWAEISNAVRFGRAKGRCEQCGRPHGRLVYHLGDGHWWDEDAASWRDGIGRFIEGLPSPIVVRSTYVVLACAHRDHDPTNCSWRNLIAFCQRCHMIHDRPHHNRVRWATLFRRKALGDLFEGAYL